MDAINRNIIADGVRFNSIRDSRFKTMKISVNMIVPLSEETAAENALLSAVLSRSCKAYPSYRLLCRRLSALYGAELGTSVSKMGDRQVMTMIVSGLDDRYALTDESIAEELSKLICSVIFEPNLDGEAFNEYEVEQERRQLKDLMDSDFNDKRIYANSQLIKYMCENEVFATKRYGSAEKLSEVTSRSLYYVWKRLLQTAVFEIMYIGDSAPDKARAVFTESFSKIDRTPCLLSTAVVRKTGEVKEITEEMDLAQSKLVMGFRTDCALPDSEVNAVRLMCAILGGTASSKLFCNVREKQSLCYYCSSSYNKHNGILVVDSGVEGENIEKAKAGILKEIEDMKNGVISDFEISATKMAVINSFNTSKDSIGGLDAWYYSQMFDPSFKTVEEMCDCFNAITKEEIVNAAKKLTLDTIFVLKNN